MTFEPKARTLDPTKGYRYPCRAMIISPIDRPLETWLVMTPKAFNKYHGFFWGIPITREVSQDCIWELSLDQNSMKAIALTAQLQPVPFTKGQAIVHPSLNRTLFLQLQKKLTDLLSYADE